MFARLHSAFASLLLLIGTTAVAQAQAATSKPVSSLLFIGNSITRHGPAPALGWEGSWGMAASTEETDYVHRVVSRFAKLQGSAPAFVVQAEGGIAIPGEPEQAAHLAELAQNADLAVIQLGENDRIVTAAGFRKPYEDIILILRKANPEIRIVCTGTWSPPSGSHEKDAFIRELCAKHRLPFADLSTANRDPRNRAGSTGTWTHPGVNWHPSDAGMEAYAEAIMKAYLAGDAAIPTVVKKPVSKLAAGQPVFHETFKDPETANRWNPIPTTIEPGVKTNALKITNTDPAKAVYFRHTLDTALLKGGKVTVSARIKGTGISAPPKPWNGIKVMITLQDAEGALDHPQAPVALTGNFPWKEVGFTHYIPDTTATAHLVIGMELITGTLWIEDIKIVPLP